jgi:hypothetical protein
MYNNSSPYFGAGVVAGADGHVVVSAQQLGHQSAGEDVREQSQLVFQPYADICTLSEYLARSADWEILYPVFSHIEDLIETELIQENCKINRNQNLFQLSIGVGLLLIVLVTYGIEIYKSCLDKFKNARYPIEFFEVFFLPISGLIASILTIGLASFNLYILHKHKHKVRDLLSQSAPRYKFKRTGLISPHKKQWAFFEIAKLIATVKLAPTNLDQPITSEQKKEIEEKLSNIKRQFDDLRKSSLKQDKNELKFEANNITGLHNDDSRDSINYTRRQVIAHLQELLLPTINEQRSKFFRDVWSKIISDLELIHQEQIKANLHPANAVLKKYKSNYTENFRPDQIMRSFVLDIICEIANRREVYSPNMFVAMDLKQTYVPTHIQNALVKHRSYDPAVAKSNNDSKNRVFYKRILQYIWRLITAIGRGLIVIFNNIVGCCDKKNNTRVSVEHSEQKIREVKHPAVIAFSAQTGKPGLLANLIYINLINPMGPYRAYIIDDSEPNQSRTLKYYIRAPAEIPRQGVTISTTPWVNVTDRRTSIYADSVISPEQINPGHSISRGLTTQVNLQ